MSTNVLILVRHSVSRPQPDRPAQTWELTDGGRARGVALATQLRPYSAAGIVSSAETKARQTAEIVAAELSLPVTIEPDLGEHRRENAPYLNSQAAFQATIAAVLTHPDQLIYGEETGAAAAARFQAAVQRQLDAHPNQSVIAVTHGTILALFLAQVAQVEPVSFWQSLGMPAYVVLRLPDLAVRKIVHEVVA